MQIIGIINLTPDSFSNNGEVQTVQTARQMLAEGASLVDVGAESTRPNATPITPQQEWQRLEQFLAESQNIPLSLDTRNFETARQALAYKNVKILNDVSGFNHPKMLELAPSFDKIIAMHSLTVPADKNITIKGNVVDCILQWIAQKFKQLTAANLPPENIIFDVGLGFGKTSEQSLELVKAAPLLAEFCHKLGAKILYGHSRKSFLNASPDTWDAQTAKITAYLHESKVDYVRVHNVELNKTS